MITGVVLARNEQDQIVECLTTLQPHVDELLLIDMESEDGTVERAGPFVSTVLSHRAIGSFDCARNVAIPAARYDWLWFVDADERIPMETGQLIRNLVAQRGREFEAITYPFKTYFCRRWMRHCGWWPGYTMPRVLKRGHFRFSEKLHGGVELDGREVRIIPNPSLAVDHFSYSSVQHYIEKLNRYTTTEADQMAQRGQVHDWRRATADMMRDLWTYYERNPGQQDGEHGWILAWLSGQYRWLSHAKLLDRQSTNGNPSVPASLDAVLAEMHDQLSILRASRPVTPLGIVWRSPIWDPSGYADEGRCFAKALAHDPRPLAVETIDWAKTRCPLQPAEDALMQALVRGKRPKYAAAIANCIPVSVEPDPRASLNILRTTFETDRIPGFWHKYCRRFDEVWVTADHVWRAFCRSGVPPEQLRIVPSCCDTDLFRPEGATYRLPRQLRGRFVFLSVFDWVLRKGWDTLLRAYCDAFQPHDNVALFLKI